MPIPAVPPLRVTAGVVALVLLWPRVRSGPPMPRMMSEVFGATLAVSSLLCGLLVAVQRLP